MYVVSTTDKFIRIGRKYQNMSCDVKAQGTDLFYVVDPVSTDVIRTAPAPVQVSATEYVAGVNDLGVYTVADSSVFRVGEVLEWFAADGTTEKGSVRVESIPDATSVSVRVIERETSAVNEDDDKLQYGADSMIPEGDSIKLKTIRSTTILVKSSVANTALNMLVTPLTSTVEKKN